LGLIAFAIAAASELMLLFFINHQLVVSIYAVGMILLAVATLRANSFPRWVLWMWVIALLLGIPGILMPNLQAILFLLAAIGFGLGFIGAGYHLLTIGPTSS